MDAHLATVVFYALALILLNFEPNTLTFMLPAELFPTKYRGTCYGIAAACGKLGAILIQAVNWAAKVSDENSGDAPLGGMLMGFALAALLGALFSWVWIPDVQQREVLDESAGRDGLIRRL
jgi:PHS family inorganic phosphate transporter-like MFS transporter